MYQESANEIKAPSLGKQLQHTVICTRLSTPASRSRFVTACAHWTGIEGIVTSDYYGRMISESQHFSSICIVERKKSMGYRFAAACNLAQISRLFLPYLPDHGLLRCRYHGNKTKRLLLSIQNSLVPRALSLGRKRENPGNEVEYRNLSLFGYSYPPSVIRFRKRERRDHFNGLAFT